MLRKTNSIDSQPQIECILCFVRLIRKSRDSGSLTQAHHNCPESLLSFSLDAVRRDISMRNNPFLFWLLLFADGVFGSNVVKSVSVSVLVGDSVTLNTDDTETQGAEALRWKIQDEKQFIAELDIEAGKKLVVLGNNDERFKGRLELNNQTGSLTITNLNTADSRVYELHIKKKESKFTRFNVTVRDEMNTVLVKEGDTVTLRTGLIEIKEYDLILWRSEDHLMAEIRKATNLFSLHKNAKGKFEGRLQPEHQSGSLIISDSRTTDSGDYHLHMSNSAYTLQRTIRVTVRAYSGVSPGAVAGIVVAVVILVAVAVVAAVVIYYRNKISKLESRRSD